MQTLVSMTHSSLSHVTSRYVQHGTNTLKSSWKERHSHRQVHQLGETDAENWLQSVLYFVTHTSHEPFPQLSNTWELTISQMAHISESCTSQKKTPGWYLWPSKGNSVIKYSTNYAQPVKSDLWAWHTTCLSLSYMFSLPFFFFFFF